MSSTDPARRSKRVSTLPSALKAPTSLDPTAVIAERAVLTGVYPITIGARAVIHPHARISSAKGPVTIGDGTIVWERAVIGVGSTDGEVDDAGDEDDEDGVTVGENVVVESFATVEARVVGEGTIIEAYAKVGCGVIVGNARRRYKALNADSTKFCKVNSWIEVPVDAQLPDYTVMYDQGRSRIDSTMKSTPLIGQIKASTHGKQLDALRTLIPSNLAKWA